VAGAEGANVSIGETAGWVLTYSPEYKLPDNPEAGQNTLTQLALISGQCQPDETNTLDLADCFASEPAEAFSHDQLARNVTSPTWPYLLLLATLLLPFDIAVRRLVISRYELQRAVNRVTSVVSLSRRAPEPERVEAMSRLRQAKQRAGTPTVTPPSPMEGDVSGLKVTSQPLNVTPSTPPPASAPEPPPVPTPEAAPPAEQPKPEAESTAAALLARKRQRK
jgi:hypothetical protein